MADKPAAQRTEQPTQRKLDKTKEKGQLSQSQELPAAVGIVALVLVLAIGGESFMQWCFVQIKESIGGDNKIFSDQGAFWGYFSEKLTSSIIAAMPFFATLFIGSILACAAVSGLNFAPQALKLKFDEINPIKGFGKLFNIKSLVKLGISIAKLIIVSVIVWFYLRSRLEELAAIRWAWSAQIITAISKIALGMLVRICIGLVIIAMLDVVFQKWKYIEDLKMTKQEVKQERKDTEGSPELKSKLRQIQMTMSKKRMLEEVPKANVILVNPTHVAVALKYDGKTMDAPLVLAKGADHLAQKIRETARAYGVPIIRKPELARTIYSTVKEGEPIPENLYTAVAEVLAMIYRLKHRSL